MEDAPEVVAAISMQKEEKVQETFETKESSPEPTIEKASEASSIENLPVAERTEVAASWLSKAETPKFYSPSKAKSSSHKVAQETTSDKESHISHSAQAQAVVQKPKKKKENYFAILNHPAIRENLLLFFGVLFIMVGEVFVVSHTWGRMSSSMRSLGIFGLLFSSSLLFYFIGYFVRKKLKINEVGLLLYSIDFLLLPLTFVVCARMLTTNILFALPSILVGGILAWATCRGAKDFISKEHPNYFTPIFYLLLLYSYPLLWFKIK